MPSLILLEALLSVDPNNFQHAKEKELMVEIVLVPYLYKSIAFVTTSLTGQLLYIAGESVTLNKALDLRTGLLA